MSKLYMSGKELKLKFEIFGWKKAEVARRFGIKPQAVQSWFSTEKLNTEILEKLCEEYEIKINDFYQGTKYAVEQVTENDKSNDVFKVILELNKTCMEQAAEIQSLKDKISTMEKKISLTEVPKSGVA